MRIIKLKALNYMKHESCEDIVSYYQSIFTESKMFEK
jgi:hypothetical protein